MLIDCHTHAFSDKIAEKAVTQLIDYYKIPTPFGGRLLDLLTAASQANLDAMIMLVAATKPEQLKPANDWILKLNEQSPIDIRKKYGLKNLPKMFCFGTFHPDALNWVDEVRRLKKAGIRGIKLHPEFQGIDLGDPRLDAFFEEVGSDFALMIHMGDPIVSSTNFSTPKKLATILRKFPKLKVIAAHLGGLYFWEEVITELAGRDLFFDTSSSLDFIPPDLLRQIFAKHDKEKILFGSDYPLKSPQQEINSVNNIKWLSTTDKEGILGKNCARLLEFHPAMT